MAEPIDIVVPILRGIQEDLAEIKVTLRKLDSVEQEVRTLKNRVITIMGLDADRAEAVKEHDVEIAAIKRRLDVLEKPR